MKKITKIRKSLTKGLFTIGILSLMLPMSVSNVLASSETGDFDVIGGALGVDYTYTTTVIDEVDVKTLTIIKGTELTISNVDKSVATEDHQIVVADGVAANIKLNGVDIDLSDILGGSPFEIKGDASCNITLETGSENTLAGGRFAAGLTVQEKDDKVASVEIGGKGKLDVYSGQLSAGIGSGKGFDAGTIIINDGYITATSTGASGIGGCYPNTVNGSYEGFSGGTIEINGGTIIATGNNGSGIGVGMSGTGASITINGGDITAKSLLHGAGIGSGISSYTSQGNVLDSFITITGGNIWATGAHQYPGIGGSVFGTSGEDIFGGEITISAGNIIATGGTSAAGIGGGYAVSNKKITISGGNVTAIAGINAAAIGGGAGYYSGIGDGGEIIISAGKVVALCVGDGDGIGNGSKGDSTTFSTGTNGSAFIYTNSITDNVVKSEWSGLIYESGNGQFYGSLNSFEITEDLVMSLNGTLNIESGKMLTVGSGATLNSSLNIVVNGGGSLINNGVIVNNNVIDNEENSTFTNNGTIHNNGFITTSPGGTVNNLQQNEANPTVSIENAQLYLREDAGVLQYAMSNTASTTWFTYTGDFTVNGSSANGLTVVSGTHNIVLDSVNIATAIEIPAIDINGGANVNLTLSGENVLTGGYNAAGIRVPATAQIIVNGSGSLKSSSTYYGAGIGGNNRESSGTVTIESGDITALGGLQAAGIGGGNSGSGGTTTISGGTVNAVGGSNAADIGGGASGSGGNITISGGKVTAISDVVRHGIGGGYKGDAGTFSTGVNGTAQIEAKLIADNDDKSGWSGIIMDGNNGQVYGEQTLAHDFDVAEGNTLSIPVGSSLTVPSEFEVNNYGTISEDDITRIILSGGIFNNYSAINQDKVDTAKALIEAYEFSNLSGSITNETDANSAIASQVNAISGISLDGITVSVETGGDPFEVGAPYSFTVGLTIENPTKTATTSVKTVLVGTSITGAVVTLDSNVLSYTGQELTKNVTSVELDGTALTENVDYTVSGNKATNAGSYTVTVEGKGEYYGTVTKSYTVAKVDYSLSRVGTGFVGYGHTSTVDLSAWGGLLGASFEEQSGWELTSTNIGGAAAVLVDGSYSIANNTLSYQFKDDIGLVDDTVTFKIATTSTNYNNFEITITVTVVDNNILTAVANPIVHTYNGLAVDNSAITGQATFDGEDVDGVWEFVAGQALTNVADSGEKNVVFKPTDVTNFREVSDTIDLTIEKAMPTGQPTFEPITTGGKTLADVVFDIDEITPSGGELGWELESTTAVTANKAYNWVYIPTDTDNYKELKGSITLYVVAASDGRDDRDDVNSFSVDPHTGIMFAGSFSSLPEVAELPLSNPTYLSTLRLMEEQISPLMGLKVVGAYDITLRNASGGITVSFPVGTQFNDMNFVVGHQATSGFVMYSGIVEDGMAHVLARGFSPFIVAIEIENDMPFNDVKASDWFYSDVEYTWVNGLMSGVSDTEFSPSQAATRAMIWTVLARMDGIETEGGATWYSKALDWAKSEGITDGTEPNGNINREQLVTMLYRFESPTAVTTQTVLSQFTDSGDISEYAISAMEWAVAQGIINGSDGRLNPKDNATRAEIAAILHRFMEMQ